MPSCCGSGAYERLFDAREARRSARQYRERGLDANARRMVRFLVDRGVSGQTVLEVGGGIGAIQVELLRSGAERAVNVEISSGYESVARQLLEEKGLQDRVERHVLDFAREPDALGNADVVIMHRVICCYPDAEALVSAAAAKAQRYLAMSFPLDHVGMRVATEVENLWHRLTRSDFRAYVHPPGQILAAAGAWSFRTEFEHRGWAWQTTVLSRTKPRDESGDQGARERTG